MKINNMSETTRKIWMFIKKYKYVMAILLVGIVLINLPTSAPAEKTDTPTSSAVSSEFSLGEQERRFAAALSKIEGAGKVDVVLTLKSTQEQVLAKDESSSSSVSGKGDSPENSMERDSTTVIVSSGSSVENPVTLKYIYPEYLGALIVCEGADNAVVKYQLIKAISGLTGLGMDKIVVTKMNKS